MDTLITGELLLKYGFTKIPFYENVYEKGDVRIHTSKNKKVKDVLFVLYNDGEIVLQKEISTLGQLRDLYFESTGEELPGSDT